MHRRASLLSRLALAVFAALGFVAPVDRPEPACAAQVTAKALEPAQAPEVRIAAAPVERLAAKTVDPEPSVPRPSERSAGRRYLLNRAWLL